MPFVQNTPSGGAAGVSEDSDPSKVFLDNVRTFELPDDDTKGVVANFILPRNIDLLVDPSMMIEFFISSTGSGNGNVRFRTTARYIAVGETTAKAADETVSQTEAAGLKIHGCTSSGEVHLVSERPTREELDLVETVKAAHDPTPDPNAGVPNDIGAATKRLLDGSATQQDKDELLLWLLRRRIDTGLL